MTSTPVAMSREERPQLTRAIEKGRIPDAPRPEAETAPADDGAEESKHDPYRDEGGEG